MSKTSDFTEPLRQILLSPNDGVVGLVDDLLRLCQDHGLQLDWQTNRFRVRSNGSDWEELTGLSLRKSVFRAILARVAVLCNEQHPESVSLFGGQAEWLSGTAPSTIFKVAFANTTSEQRLELTTELPPLTEIARHYEQLEK